MNLLRNGLTKSPSTTLRPFAFACAVIMPFLFAWFPSVGQECQEPPLGQMMMGGGGENPECSDYTNYVPDQYSPTLTIKINFHFLYNSIADPQNFMPDWDGVDVLNDMNGFIYADMLTAAMNDMASQNEQLTIPPGNSIPMLAYKVAFFNAGVYFHETPTYFDACNSELSTLMTNFAVNPATEINCFFSSPTGSGAGCGWGGVAEAIGGANANSLLIKREWNSNYDNVFQDMILYSLSYEDALGWRVKGGARMLMHEIGHDFFLAHTICNAGGSDGCTDTPTASEINTQFGCDPALAACCQVGSNGNNGCCSNNLMDYDGGFALSPCQLGKVHYDMIRIKRNYLKDDYCTNQNITTTIPTGQNLVWEATRIFKGDLIISGGATVTVKCDVHIPEGNKIVVMPGGKLVVDGGRLTNLCGLFWKGVEVWGQSTLKQLAANQGTIELKNEAVVEHALCGVRLGKFLGGTSYDWSKTGGIVKSSTESSFRNNKKDVEFLAYQNSQVVNGQTQLLKNVSFFTQTEFLIDEVIPGMSNLGQRVSLYDVDGIRFTSCNFHIEGVALTNYSALNRGYGIYSSVSSFEIVGRCAVTIPIGQECDPGYLTAETLGETGSDILPSRFDNYNYAVRATGPDGFSNTTIKETIFSDNQRGIYLTAQDQADITRNRFFVSNLSSSIEYGLSLEGCTGYKVARNIFEGVGSISNNITGAWITNSGEDPNEIYLNDFLNLNTGSTAQGLNVDELNDYSGLEMLCGLYEDSKYNIAVNKVGTEEGKIALRQGNMAVNSSDVQAPAGNLFTNTNWGGGAPFTDYFICPNNECDPVIYEHHNTASSFPVEPLYIDPLLVETSSNLPYFTTRAGSCPIEHGHVISHLTMHAKIQQAREEIEEAKEELEELVDGGSTSSVISFINDPNNSSAAIRAELLPMSPFLSDVVQKALIAHQPALDQWHLCELFISCSPLKPEMLQAVDDANLLSEYLFQLLESYQDGSNARISKEMALKQAELEKAYALNAFIRIQIQEDEEGYNLEEIKAIMTGEEINDEIRKKVAILRQQGALAEAQTLLNEYFADQDQDVWKDVMQVILDLDAQGGYHTATATQISTLETLASSEKTGALHAKALLEFITGVAVEEELNLPENSLKSRSVEIKNRPSLAGVYPNPANDVFYITYILPHERENASIKLFDLNGRLIEELNVTKGHGILEMNARKYHSGTYIFELVLNGTSIAKEKFQILH